MAGNLSLDSSVASQWGTVVRAYCELMDDVMPHLPESEQIVYHRLFRLSHVRQNPFVQCRYEELAGQCGLSLSTLRRAVKGLRAKNLIKTVWQSHSGTTFQVDLPSSHGTGERESCPPPLRSQGVHQFTMRSVLRIGSCLSSVSSGRGRHVCT